MKNYEIVFESERIYYIKVTKLLVNDYLEMINSKDVNRFISLKEKKLSYNDEIEWIEKTLNNQSIIFSMIEKETGRYIGNIGITKLYNDSCEIGISITPSMQDKHYGTESITRFIDYIQHDLKINNIDLVVFSNNSRGIHLYEKLGFKEYKRDKNIGSISGDVVDDIYMRYENKLDKYLNQDIFNPKYLFHGSPYLLDKIEPRQAIDKSNKNNEDFAVYLSSWFLTSSAYAFRNKLKEYNKNYSFDINNEGKKPAMVYDVDYIPDNLNGYVYVFEKNDDIIKDVQGNENTTQYKCYHELKPIDIIKINFKDYEKYYDNLKIKVENNKNSLKK